MKNIFQELNDRYKYQNEKLEILKNERVTLENENSKLIEFIKLILLDDIKNPDNKNSSFNLTNDDINIKPNNFESKEMFEKLDKL